MLKINVNSKTTILLVFEKIFSCLFIPNYTRNHVINYTNTKDILILSLFLNFKSSRQSTE